MSFCAKCIDPMGEESDHVVLVALTSALQVPMRVVHVDGSSKDDGQLDIKDFGCDDRSPPTAGRSPSTCCTGRATTTSCTLDD